MKATSGKNQATDSIHEEFENAKQAAVDAYANFLEAKNHLKAAAKAAGIEFKETANEQFEEALGRVSEQKAELLENTEEYIRENPIYSAALAFMSGFILSKLLGK